MNMKLKAVAAAVAMAISGGAGAAVTQTVQGNSEMLFTVWDAVAKVSFNMDIPSSPNVNQPGRTDTFNLNDFLPAGTTAGGLPAPGGSFTVAPGTVEALNTKYSWGMSNKTGWDQFVAASNKADWQWQVVAGDSTGTTSRIEQKRYIFTSRENLATVDAGTNQTALNSMQNINSPLAAMDIMTGDDPSGFFTSGDGQPYVGASLLNNMAGAVPFQVSGSLNESLNFFYVSGTCTSFQATSCTTPDGTRALQFQNGGFANGNSWSFTESAQGFNLTYMTTAENSPVVPIPAAVWLLGSALVGLVGVARRRSSLT